MFPISAIHQIEVTSRCNLRCKYCAHPKMPRPKQDMDWATFALALNWAKYFAERGDVRELNLAGIGESTMHPEFMALVETARAAMPAHVRLILATNGLIANERLAQCLADNGVWVWVSLHRPEKAGPAVELYKRYGVLKGVSADASVAAMNWAGQVDWHVSAPRRECMWVKQGRVMVMADGRITRCCLDSTGQGVIAEVHEDLSQVQTSPYELCRTCDQDVGVPLPKIHERILREGECHGHS